MNLNDISVGLVLQALDVYVKVAFIGLPPEEKLPDFGADYDESIEKHIELFEDESTKEKGVRLRRYILRLGNSKYPFMKFGIQEHLIQDEFFFMVDTHDDMFSMPTSEYDELKKIRAFNREIKGKIEELWEEKDIPTTATHKKAISGGQKDGGGHLDEEFKNKTVLIVDDDPMEGDTLEELLKSRGFGVERLYDGIDAIREADPLRHDLIVMDNDMKIMDGLEACRILKEDPRRCSIPIMIASARTMDIPMMEKADAYLAKPFHKDILFSFIEHIFKINR